MRAVVLFSLAVSLSSLSACGGGSAAPTAVPTPTTPATTYVMATADGARWLRTVAAAYEQGDEATAEQQCLAGRTQLANQDLKNAIGPSGDRSASLDYKTLEMICVEAKAQGWAAVRDAVRRTIDQ